ncbi:MAG: hypothetical protein HQM12_17255 [SAR324 cluster bacterium]|nr:hypothetical protein [SAR324 cluster bacterium]
MKLPSPDSDTGDKEKSIMSIEGSPFKVWLTRSSGCLEHKVFQTLWYVTQSVGKIYPSKEVFSGIINLTDW